MPDLPLTREWSAPVTLAADTVVQVQNGGARITTQDPATSPLGTLLAPNDAITLHSGVTFRAKAASLGAILSMEAF